MKKLLILDIGCGESKKEFSLGLDFRKTKSTDIIADARYLPFKNQSFDHVYSSHLIEHFPHATAKAILSEWTRVLKKNGKIEIRCPDLRARALLFFLFPNWKNIKNIYGGQDYEGNYHKSGFSYRLLKGVLRDLRIQNIKRIYGGYKGIPFIPDSLHIIGTKKD